MGERKVRIRIPDGRPEIGGAREQEVSNGRIRRVFGAFWCSSTRVIFCTVKDISCVRVPVHTKRRDVRSCGIYTT